MEIFRSDGSGRDYLNNRLWLVCSEAKKIMPSVFKSIKIINDHKGDLFIHVDNGTSISEVKIIYSLFNSIWTSDLACECNVSILKKEVEVYPC